MLCQGIANYEMAEPTVCLPLSSVLAVFLLTARNIGAGEQEPLHGQETLRRWGTEMKIPPRGPFQHIRWFCKDGTIHSPKEYPCGDRGGSPESPLKSPQTNPRSCAKIPLTHNCLFYKLTSP